MGKKKRIKNFIAKHASEQLGMIMKKTSTDYKFQVSVTVIDTTGEEV